MSRELERVQEDHKRAVLQVRDRLMKHIDSALATMIELSESSESEAVRFSATKDLLDRAGIKSPPQTVEVNVEVHQAELQQVDREALVLLERLGRNHELPEHTTPDLVTLFVLEDDEDLISADVVDSAIEVNSTEV